VLRKQDPDEDVEATIADKAGGDPFDGVDETIHPRAIHVRSERVPMEREERRQEIPAAEGCLRVYCASALYLVTKP